MRLPQLCLMTNLSLLSSCRCEIYSLVHRPDPLMHILLGLVLTRPRSQPGETPDIRDALCPLWRKPYSEQLKVKQELCFDALCRLTSELAMCITQTQKPAWLQAAIETEATHGSAACCPVQVLTSMHIYRNSTKLWSILNSVPVPRSPTRMCGRSQRCEGLAKVRS